MIAVCTVEPLMNQCMVPCPCLRITQLRNVIKMRVYVAHHHFVQQDGMPGLKQGSTGFISRAIFKYKQGATSCAISQMFCVMREHAQCGQISRRANFSAPRAASASCALPPWPTLQQTPSPIILVLLLAYLVSSTNYLREVGKRCSSWKYRDFKL